MLNSVGKSFILVNKGYQDQNAVLRQQFLSTRYNEWLKKNNPGDYLEWYNQAKEKLGIKL
jgi:hypothetical protein